MLCLKERKNPLRALGFFGHVARFNASVKHLHFSPASKLCPSAAPRTDAPPQQSGRYSIRFNATYRSCPKEEEEEEDGGD